MGGGKDEHELAQPVEESPEKADSQTLRSPDSALVGSVLDDDYQRRETGRRFAVLPPERIFNASRTPGGGDPMKKTKKSGGGKKG